MDFKLNIIPLILFNPITPFGKHDCISKASLPFISSSNLIFGIILYHAVPKIKNLKTNIYDKKSINNILQILKEL